MSRLIDADALIPDFLVPTSANNTPCKRYVSMEQIHNAPTIEPERKTGKWIGGELGYCTCCGHEGCASDMWDRCEKPHCPNCGLEVEGVQT